MISMIPGNIELLKIIIQANQYKERDVNGNTAKNSTEAISNQKV